MIKVKKYVGFNFNITEIKRYAKISNTSEFDKLINECIDEVKDKLTYKVCYDEFDVNVINNRIDFGVFDVNSSNLSVNLAGSNKAIIFATTIGIEIDRLINKYLKIAPSKAIIFQAIGAERIETLANAFNNEIATMYPNFILKPRYSPGYGDFDIKYQKKIFDVLNCYKNIGLTLNDSLIMSPSKSVTAIVGLEIKG